MLVYRIYSIRFFASLSSVCIVLHRYLGALLLVDSIRSTEWHDPIDATELQFTFSIQAPLTVPENNSSDVCSSVYIPTIRLSSQNA
jgi:hypothetical protein